MRIPPLKKHNTHRAEVRAGVGPHRAQYYCLDCNKHISWLSKSEFTVWLANPDSALNTFGRRQQDNARTQPE